MKFLWDALDVVQSIYAYDDLNATETLLKLRDSLFHRDLVHILMPRMNTTPWVGESYSH